MAINTRGRNKRYLIEKEGSDVTFFRDFENSHSPVSVLSPNDISRGSYVGIFTATRSATTPATYVNKNGVIETLLLSNVERFTHGFYDTTGFVVRPGIIMELTSANLIPKSSVIDDATWAELNTTAENADTGSSSPDGTVTAPSLTATDANGTLLLASAVTARTYSVFLKRKTGTGNIDITADSGATWTTVTVYDYKWVRVQVTAASASQTCGIRIVTSGDAVYVWGNQFEAQPYATTLIPTTSVALTRNVEVIKFPISGNMTDTQSVFFKYTPFSTFANDSSNRNLLQTDTKNRIIGKISTNVPLNSLANSTDNGTVFKVATTTPQASVSYVHASVFQHVSPYISVYTNGVLEATYTAGDYTAPAWGTNFWVGCSTSSANQINGIIQAVAMFSGVKSAAEVVAITEVLNF